MWAVWSLCFCDWNLQETVKLTDFLMVLTRFKLFRVADYLRQHSRISAGKMFTFTILAFYILSSIEIVSFYSKFIFWVQMLWSIWSNSLFAVSSLNIEIPGALWRSEFVFGEGGCRFICLWLTVRWILKFDFLYLQHTTAVLLPARKTDAQSCIYRTFSCCICLCPFFEFINGSLGNSWECGGKYLLIWVVFTLF